MRAKSRVVIDSNVLISALLTPHRTAGQVLDVCHHDDLEILFSEDTLAELATRVFRPKFDKYVTVEQRTEFLKSIHDLAVFEDPQLKIEDCRDPDDNKFLELAIAGEAVAIVTGDKDLLTLHPFRGVPIITPAQFLVA